MIPEDYFYKTEQVLSTQTVVAGGGEGKIGTVIQLRVVVGWWDLHHSSGDRLLARFPPSFNSS